MASGEDCKVLIVVPTLGARSDLLRLCLDSVLGQRTDGVRIVVVAPPQAAAVAALCTELHVQLVTQESQGIGAAINLGWRALGQASEYWAWLGDDDLLAEGSVAAAVEALEQEPAAAMVYGDCEYVDEAGRRLFVVRPTRLAAALLRWGPNLVPQPGSLARADAIRSAGWLDESLLYAMDLDLFLRLARVGPIVYTRRTLAAFRWHAGSTTVSSTQASEHEAAWVRRRSRRGWERYAGPLLELPAGLLGQALNRLQRRPR